MREPQPPVVTERLLVLVGSSWRGVDLPSDWVAGVSVSLVPPVEGGNSGANDSSGGVSSGGAFGERPSLVTRPDRGSPERLVVHHPTGPDAWSAAAFTLEPRGGVRALRVGGQLVLVQHHPTEDGFMARFYVLRGDRAVALGQLVLDLALDGGRWAAVVKQGAAAVAAGARTLPDGIAAAPPDAGPLGPSIAALDLQGQPVGSTIVPGKKTVSPLAEQADFIIMVGVVVLATLLLFSFWRRDPTINELVLPEGVALAPLGRRFLAGVIDLTPGLLVGSLAFRLSLDELYTLWPGRGIGVEWVKLIPGLTTVAVTVAHTAILEAFTGRSLGKFCTGLRVSDLRGHKPRPWQALVRCGLKAFDLIAYLLLVLPVISPYRQRLGDMIASTVVVTGAAPPPSDSDSDSDSSPKVPQAPHPAGDDQP